MGWRAGQFRLAEVGVLRARSNKAEAPVAASEPPPTTSPRSSKRVWRSWPLWLVVAVALASLVVIGTLELTRPLPGPVTSFTISRTVSVSGHPSRLPWPAQGGAAVAVPSLGMVTASGPERPVPIASLTKIMTAYIVLRDHPLTPAEQGPSIAISVADQTETDDLGAANDTYIPIQAGESLTERQLLDGLIVRSANNFADVLAEWDAGSVPAFVAKMNVTARFLDMSATHYVDTNGVDAGTVSTAADQLRLTSVAMRIPAFVAVADQQTVTLPLAGTQSNYVTQVGTDGIVGVKSGFTQAAMGCLVLAALRFVDGKPVLVLAAVTGQPGYEPLTTAGDVTVPLLDATASNLRTVSVLEARQKVATVTASWTPHDVSGVTSHAVSDMVWPGDTVTLSVHGRPDSPRARPGTTLGTIGVSVAGEQRQSVQVVTSGAFPGPSLMWRLSRF
jgi:serine-type D-Ala-D-Ala carboxypeptidase (penicillin-binding protein 5/6)